MYKEWIYEGLGISSKEFNIGIRNISLKLTKIFMKFIIWKIELCNY